MTSYTGHHGDTLPWPKSHIQPPVSPPPSRIGRIRVIFSASSGCFPKDNPSIVQRWVCLPPSLQLQTVGDLARHLAESYVSMEDGETIHLMLVLGGCVLIPSMGIEILRESDVVTMRRAVQGDPGAVARAGAGEPLRVLEVQETSSGERLERRQVNAEKGEGQGNGEGKPKVIGLDGGRSAIKTSGKRGEEGMNGTDRGNDKTPKKSNNQEQGKQNGTDVDRKTRKKRASAP
ncbi:unnamed protein product, partial [Discosporangium mesarthrocarpum]